MGTHVKNAGPQIGDSTGDFEDQAWTLVEENVALIGRLEGTRFLDKVIRFACLFGLLS